MMVHGGHISVASRRGSALILTVVLTSLLALVGVLFLMTARIDKMASSATADNRELTFAVDSIAARISEELARDVPGVLDGQEYHDFSDPNDPWLADLEPYRSASDPNAYYWRQISDVIGYLQQRGFARRDIAVDPPGPEKVIRDYPPIDLVNGQLKDQMADADGDGIADSKWIEYDGWRSSKGRPIYAAVRIIDNGGMLNVNTAYKFDPNSSTAPKTDVDGHTQLQIDLTALGSGPTDPAAALLGARANNTASLAALDLTAYEREVIWRYDRPGAPYTPFDLSDELELRYRYCLNSKALTRLEAPWNVIGLEGIAAPYDGYHNNTDPLEKGRRLDDWRLRVTGALGAGAPDRRHLLTTYNLDRILTPEPLTSETGTKRRKMVNVNTAGELAIREALAAALAEADPNSLGIAEKVLQITANLRDYIDDDDELTVIHGLSSPYYGFERPCIYISELAYRQVRDPDTNDLHTSYAVELYRPYFEDNDPCYADWRLVIDNPAAGDVTLDITWSGSRRFHVLLTEDEAAPLRKDYVAFTDPEEPVDTRPLFGYLRTAYAGSTQDLGSAGFEAGATISLQRMAAAPGQPASAGKWVVVDYKRVPDSWFKPDGEAHGLQRDIAPHKGIRRLWAAADRTPALGSAKDNYVDTQRPEVIQAHPANKPLTNIGELGLILARSAYSVPEGATAADCLVDLQNPIYRKLFNYLTVIDPSRYVGLGADETRVMGRININTAPSFVLAQLPWMRYPDGTSRRAAAIVAHRNADGAFESIGELMQVPEMHGLALDQKDNRYDVVARFTPRGPDLTPDAALDDFEERDLIFTRISNLVTVRSDVFTAYLLVRVGTDGPQRRVIAIFDRSRVHAAADRVRLIAQYLVPDPR